MAAITVQGSSATGTALSLVAASGGGDTVAVTNDTELYVRNSDASAKTVTVVRPGTDAFGIAIPDIAVVVAAGATTAIRLLPEFRDPATGLVSITYSAVTSVTVAAMRA